MAEKSGNNLTPEEQLLKLIEGHPSDPTASVPISTSVASGEMLLPALKLAKSGGLKSAGRRLVGMMGVTPGGGGVIKLINRLLVTIMITLTGYLVWGFANATVPDVGKPPAPDGGNIAQPPENIDVAEYLKYIEARDIFNPPQIVTPPQKTDVKAVTQTPEVVPQPAKTVLNEATKHFKIVGINWDPAPPMVMIEDNIDGTTQITHCLREGETFDTKVQVSEVPEKITITIKQITKEKIILQYEQEQSEIIANW
ncbi:MAG: hypothetical protein V1701_10010 [Planctomycetota bacterium]